MIAVDVRRAGSVQVDRWIQVDVVGSVSAGLGGGGGVAESSRVESREQASGLDARRWSQSRSR
jgi:hypothetical protein